MKLTRREAMGVGLGAAAALTLPAMPAFADSGLDAAIKKFTGGAAPAEGKVEITAPEIAENGNTVPIEISVESPMSDKDYVQSVIILADGNPSPGVATLHFTPLSGAAFGKVRIRLSKTQNVLAVAKTSTGKFFMAKKTVKVTIGGCGG